jgi:hypothetical protein
LSPGRRRRRRPSRSRNRFQDLDEDGVFWGPQNLWDLTFWLSTLQLYVNRSRPNSMQDNLSRPNWKFSIGTLLLSNVVRLF